MRSYYRRGGKGAAPEGFDRVYTEVDGDGNVLRELLAYVRAGDSVTVEMGGELGGTAGAFVEMALALLKIHTQHSKKPSPLPAGASCFLFSLFRTSAKEAAALVPRGEQRLALHG